MQRQVSPQSPFSRLAGSRWAVLLAALIARLFAIPLAHIGNNPALWEYWAIAKNLLLGHGYAFDWFDPATNITGTYASAYMPPGQVMIDYSALLIFGNSVGAQAMVIALNIVWGILFVMAARALMQQIAAPRRVAVSVTWLAALYPPFVIATGSFGVLSVTLLLTTLLFLFGHRFFTSVSGRGKSALLFGATAGLLSFFRSEAYILFATLILLALWQHRRSLRRMLAPILIAVAAMATVVSPWMIRNAVTLHRFIPSSTNGSFNFWRGFSEEATGSSNQADGSPVWLGLDQRIVGSKMDAGIEQRFAEYTAEQSTEWIAQHPAAAVELTVKKAFLFWIWDWYNDDMKGTLYSILHLVLVALTAYGAVIAAREWPALDPNFRTGILLFGAYAAVYTFIAMAFFTMPRLQIFLDSGCLTVGSYGAVALFRNRKTASALGSVRSFEHVL